MNDLKADNRWGYWATLGWAFLAYVAGQAAASAVVFWWAGGDLAVIAVNPYSGALVALTVLVLNPVTIAVLLGAIRLAKANAVEYLALVRPRSRDVAKSVVLLLVLIALGDAFFYAIGHQVVSPFQRVAVRSAVSSGWLVPLVIATIVFAPIGEEILFRGFLFRGFVRPEQPRWLSILFVVVISLLFALPHVQYDLLDMSQVLVFGLFVGWVRLWSGSTLLTMLLHAVFNLEGTIETAIALKFFS